MGRRDWRGLFRRRRADELAPIDADITAFGEELARHVFVPTGQDSDALVTEDLRRALEAYERAKNDFVGDRDRQDAEDVMRALADGRHALACASARAAGDLLPTRRPPCFFDPRHGPSTAAVRWSPPEGAPRLVDVCAADAIRIQEGHAPIDTGRLPVPAPRTTRQAPVIAPRTPSPAPTRRAQPRPVPGTQPLPEQGTNWRPYRMWPPGTPAAQRAEGSGNLETELLRPDTEQPVILVIRLHAGGSAELMGRPARRRLIKFGSGVRRMIVPLPPNGSESVQVRLETHRTWHMWLQPLDDLVPVLETKLNSNGPYLFRYLGGPATIRVSQRNGGAFWLDELTGGGETGQRLITGKGTFDGEARLRGPGFIHVRSSAIWHVTLLRSDQADQGSAVPGGPGRPTADRPR
ncbi:hypothetical protein [Streptomyces sp. NPDC058620]|uniref:hypothetical protein n=1 Tax=Streptomyces sp. NPDC058620 TaxID=3346560 RepID=UPI0036641911